eukprot:scaffold51567_cov64-Phaeocystis_antarctica.AAC.1
MGVSQGFKGVPGGIPATVRKGGWPRRHVQAVPGPVPRARRHLRLGAGQEDHQRAMVGQRPRVGARKDAILRGATVTEGELDEALAGKPNPASFLQMLASACKPEDFVVVKLDIDTPAIEQTIVAVLAQRPDLTALIDELFFEYHFYFDGLDFGWGKNVQGDVGTAIGTMYRLRSLGIRAHFWI